LGELTGTTGGTNASYVYFRVILTTLTTTTMIAKKIWPATALLLLFSNAVFGEPHMRRFSDPYNVVTTATSSRVLATRNTAVINIGFGKSSSILRGITDPTPFPIDHVVTGAIGTRNAQIDSTLKDYLIEDKTGDKILAGTDSNIYLTIHGDKGSTTEKQLNEFFSGNPFETDALDTLTLVRLVDVGTMQSVTVRSDGSGWVSSWYVSWISVNGERATVNHWIDDESVSASFDSAKFL